MARTRKSAHISAGSTEGGKAGARPVPSIIKSPLLAPERGITIDPCFTEGTVSELTEQTLVAVARLVGQLAAAEYLRAAIPAALSPALVEIPSESESDETDQ